MNWNVASSVNGEAATGPAAPTAKGSRVTRPRGHPGSVGEGQLSATERALLGKAARAESPRSSHAARTPPANRSDPVTPGGMELWGRMCGWTLAHGHARSGDRVAIASYLGKSDAFDRAIADFSVAYADQNERDYVALQRAVAGGRLTAETGL